jgi:hypothetical protein
MKQKIRDYGYMHMDKWEVLLSITAKAMLAAEVGVVEGGGCGRGAEEREDEAAGEAREGGGGYVTWTISS